VPFLELEEVGKHFGGLPAVDGVNLGADEGEILAIVGPNGAGKSTLLKLIVGLEPASSGKITFDGHELTGLPTHEICGRGVAMVQQTPRAFPSMTVLENATLGAMFGARGRRRDEAQAMAMGSEMLRLVGLADRGGDHVESLNLHERRFLELARALAGLPKLILLDEVMAGLNDSELNASIAMVRAVRERFGVTVVWVEHVMHAVMQLAERVVVLDFGRVLAEGPAAVVMRDQKVVEAYLGTGTRTGG
jgi:ABC-type branched-subunit amino acid transport system ATPase component